MSFLNRLFGICGIFFFVLVSSIFGFDNLKFSVSDTQLNVTLFGDDVVNPVFYYKEDVKHKFLNCNFVETSSNIYDCSISLDTDYLSSLTRAILFNIDTGSGNIYSEFGILPINNFNDAFSKNLFLNLSNNLSSQLNKCNFLNNESFCSYMYDWAYSVKNLLNLYQFNPLNSSYLNGIELAMNASNLDSCDFVIGEFDCENPNPIFDNFNVSGSYKQGLMADIFLDLYIEFENTTYYDLAMSYINESNTDCDVFNGDYSCENSLLQTQGNNFGYLISTLVKFYSITGNSSFIDISNSIKDYVISNNYSDTVLVLNSLTDLYLVTGDSSLYDFIILESEKFDNLCIEDVCSVVDLKYGVELYNKLSFVSSTFDLKNFLSQNSLYKLFGDTFSSCDYLVGNYNCSFSFEQFMLSDMLNTFSKFNFDVLNPKFFFPHSKEKLNIVETNFTYVVYLNGYVSNLSLVVPSTSIFNYNVLPSNRENYLSENLTFIDQFSHKAFFNYTLFNSSIGKFPDGDISIVVSVNDTIDKIIFKQVSNDSLVSARYFCDPLNLSLWNDFDCSYDHFHGSLISSFFDGAFNSNLIVDLIYNFFFEVESSNDSRYSTCDFANDDFDCDDFVSTYNSNLQTFKESGSIRQSEMINGFYSSLVYESLSGNYSEFSFDYFVEYSYGIAEDCDVFSLDYTCYDDNFSQGMRLNSLFNSYSILGDDIFLDKAKGLISYSLSNSDYGINSEFLSAVWKFSDLTGNYTIFNNLTYLEEITINNSQDCYLNNCSVFEKSNQVDLLLNALASTNDVSYQNLIDNHLFPRTEGYVCDSFAYFSFLRYSNITPSKSILDCDFPDEVSSMSSIFSNLFSKYFSPILKNFEINISTLNSTFLNYGSNFSVSCDLKNLQDITLNNINVKLFSPFEVINGVSNSSSFSIIAPDTILIDSIGPNETVSFFWNLSASVGGIHPVSCISGKNSSSINFISDNIGLIGNLSIINLESISVTNFEDEFFLINFTNIPFMISGVNIDFIQDNFKVTNVVVYDSSNELLRNIVTSNYDSINSRLSLVDDILFGSERYLYVSGYSLTEGNSSIFVNLSTDYNGFNTVNSSEIILIDEKSFDVDIDYNLVADLDNLINIDIIINNTASYVGNNFSLENLNLSIVTSGGTIQSMDITEGLFSFKNSNVVVYETTEFGDFVSLRIVIDTSSFIGGEEYTFEIIIDSLNGFKDNIYNTFTSYKVPSSGGSSGGGGGSSGSGGSLRGGSSESTESSINSSEVAQSLELSIINVTGYQFNNGSGGNQGTCEMSYIKTFNETDIINTFDNYGLEISNYLDIKKNSFYRKYVDLGNDFLKNSGAGRLVIDKYFDLAYENYGYDSNLFFMNSLNYTIRNSECYSISIFYDESDTLSYEGLSSCDNVDEVLFSHSRDLNVFFNEYDIKLSDENYFLFMDSILNKKTFSGVRNVTEKSCIVGSTYGGVVVYDDDFINELFNSILSDAFTLLSKELNIEVNVDDLLNEKYESSNLINFDTKNNLVFDLFDNVKFNKFWIYLFILIFIIFLVGVYSRVYYNVRKLSENLFFSLSFMEKNINNYDLIKKESDKFNKNYSRYFSKITFYSLFINFKKYESRYKLIISKINRFK